MAIANMIVVGNRDTVRGASVWGLSSDGTLAWTYDTGQNTHKVIKDSSDNYYIVGQAADNGDGNGTRNIWKLTNEGVYVVGAYVLSAGYVWDIDIDETYIYIATNEGSVRCDYNLANSATICSDHSTSIKADNLGNIYIGTTGGTPYTLYKYNSSLVYQWNEDTNDGCLSIDILSDGDIVIGTNNGEIRYYKSDGSSPSAGTWAVVVDGSSAFIRVAVDNSNNIYGVRFNEAAGVNKRFICLDTSGAEQWSISTPGGDLEEIIVLDDDIYVVGDYQKAFNIFKVDTINQVLYGMMVTPNVDTLLGISCASDFSFSKLLRDDIEGFWKLNDNAGNTVVVDNSGNARNGTSTKNTSVMTTTGKINSALNFVEASVDEVNCGDIDSIDLVPYQDITVAFWMKWAGSMGGSFDTVLHKYKANVDYDGTGFLVRKPSTDGSLDAVLSQGAGVFVIATASSIPTPMTSWIFVVVRLDRSGKMWISVNNWSYFNAGIDISAYEATDLSNNQYFSIGGLANRNPTYTSFNGALDCVGIWSRLLTQEEEAQIWNEGNGTEEWGVYEVPVITHHPEDTTAEIGDVVELFVTATGFPEPTYQWYLDGSPIFEETEDIISITVAANSGGDYFCRVTNEAGYVDSDIATLSIKPYIVSQSSSTTSMKGNPIFFEIEAVGYPDLSYQWYKNDIVLGGETNSSLSFYSSTSATYKCVVTNNVGSIESAPIILTVIENPYKYKLFNLPHDLSREEP